MVSMAPNAQDEIVLTKASDVSVEAPKEVQFKRRLKKGNVVFFSVVHLCGIYGLYLIFSGRAMWQTVLLTIILNYVSILGMTAGAHRLWAHRTYKAKLPLQILLATMTAIAFQFSTITWVRDHRAHHKYSDTDADPHNSNRGLFFSHIGWLLSHKHPEVKRKGEGIDLSDVYNNPVLRFQHENFVLLGGLACFVLPTLIPLLWGEGFWVAWHLNQTRFMVSLHSIFLVNSAAHKWGNKPYDKNIASTEILAVSIGNLGEGFHNYHHTFPFDYRSAELGNHVLNPTTKVIDFFAWLGWAYDRRTASDDLVRNRSQRTGDGSGLWG